MACSGTGHLMAFVSHSGKTYEVLVEPIHPVGPVTIFETDAGLTHSVRVPDSDSTFHYDSDLGSYVYLESAHQRLPLGVDPRQVSAGWSAYPKPTNTTSLPTAEVWVECHSVITGMPMTSPILLGLQESPSAPNFMQGQIAGGSPQWIKMEPQGLTMIECLDLLRDGTGTGRFYVRVTTGDIPAPPSEGVNRGGVNVYAITIHVLVEYVQPLLFSSPRVSPPALRQWPRSDGLAGNPTRVGIGRRSVQGSLRRGGGTHT